MGLLVAPYIRVSTPEQAEKGYSIEAQKEEIKNYCKQHDYSIYNFYVDAGISGKALLSLLSDAKAGNFDGVLVWKINRLARNFKDLLQIEQLFAEHGIFLKSLSESIDTSTPYGKFGFQMLGATSELEREVIIENTKLGRDKRNQTGIYCGAAIYGYHVIPKAICIEEGLSSNLVIYEEEAKIVQKVFSWFAEGLGYKSIVNKLNNAGIKSKRGRLFSVNVIRKMLLNVVYIGKIRFKAQEGELVIDGLHQPIIDQGLWDKVQSRLGVKKGKESKKVGSFPLSSYVKCPVCGCGMTGHIAKSKRKNGTVNANKYYVCSTYMNKGLTACRPNMIPAGKLECEVFDSIQKFINQKSIIQDIYHKMNGHSNSNYRGKLDSELMQVSELDIKSKKEKLMKLFEQDKIDETEFLSRLTILEKEKQKLDINRNSKEHRKTKPTIPISKIKALISQFTQLYQTINSEERKELLTSLLSRIEVNNEKKLVKIVCRISNQSINILETEGEMKIEYVESFFG